MRALGKKTAAPDADAQHTQSRCTCIESGLGPPSGDVVPVSLYSIGGRPRSVLFSLQQNGSFARFGIVGLRPRHAGGPDRQRASAPQMVDLSSGQVRNYAHRPRHCSGSSDAGREALSCDCIFRLNVAQHQLLLLSPPASMDSL